MPVLKHFTVPETLKNGLILIGPTRFTGFTKKKKANKQNKKLVSLYFVGVIDLKLIAD